jgi:hypothetical protein
MYLVILMMCKLHKLAAFLFLVLWLPVTSHCQLEKVPGLEFLQCASDTPENSNCEGDACQTIESGQYKISDNSQTVPVPVFQVLPTVKLSQTECVQPVFGPLRLLTCAPPELPPCWRFILRAALPVRAPSLVS